MKASLLKKLTNEELKLLTDITHSDIIEELESRKPRKPQLVIKIGDCFYAKDCVGNLSLIKITGIEEGNGWFNCDEICIEVDEFDHTEVDYFDASYHIDDASDWESINASLYENVLTLVNARKDAVTKVLEQFNSQIRKLCQELNQNQEKW